MTALERKVAEAIKELRAYRSESQQEFSEHVGVAARTIARYEGYKPPKGTVLLRLASLASESNRFDLREVFLDAENTEVSSRVSSIAGVIRRLRYELGYTQQKLADEAGLTTGAIAAAETRSASGDLVIEKLRNLANKHGLTDIENLLRTAKEIQTARRDVDRNFSLEQAAELRYKVLDNVRALPIFEFDTGGVAPVDFGWLLAALSPEQRDYFDEVLVDLALEVANRFVSGQPTSVIHELRKAQNEAQQAKGLTLRGRNRHPADLSVEDITRQRLLSLYSSVIKRVDAVFLYQLISMSDDLWRGDRRLYALSWLLNRCAQIADTTKLREMDGFLEDSIETAVTQPFFLLRQQEYKMLQFLYPNAAGKAHVFPRLTVVTNGDVAAVHIARLLTVMKPAQAAEKLGVSLQRFEDLRLGHAELSKAEDAAVRQVYSETLDKAPENNPSIVPDDEEIIPVDEEIIPVDEEHTPADGYVLEIDDPKWRH